MNELALFAGAGGGILGGKLLGWRTVCAVEWEPYAACVLAARQNDGFLPPFPIWDDIQTFDGRPWRGIVDVVSGGFPCQDISAAGRGAGIDGERSGMWHEMARVVGEVRPRYVFVENSPMLVHRGLERVLGDLTALGYDARWTVMGAADVGANHQRDRIWILAHSNGMRELQPSWRKCNKRDGAGISGETVADTECRKSKMGWDDAGVGWIEKLGSERNAGSSWWAVEPNVGRVANGVAARVDRLKAIGNGQVPLCAATAWRFLTGR
jgi:DNA (cytosine-5)-methyltransferase 1